MQEKRAWSIFINNYLFDIMYFDANMTAEEVKKYLVDHDGFSANIVCIPER